MYINRLAPPTRAVIWRVIERALSQRHAHALKIKPSDLSVVLAAVDYEALSEIGFYAITDIGDEDQHKDIMLGMLKRIGIE